MGFSDTDGELGCSHYLVFHNGYLILTPFGILKYHILEVYSLNVFQHIIPLVMLNLTYHSSALGMISERI